MQDPALVQGGPHAHEQDAQAQRRDLRLQRQHLRPVVRRRRPAHVRYLPLGAGAATTLTLIPNPTLTPTPTLTLTPTLTALGAGAAAVAALVRAQGASLLAPAHDQGGRRPVASNHTLYRKLYFTEFVQNSLSFKMGIFVLDL